MKGSKKAQYSKEVEEIKHMRELGKILKAGDLENALLSNAAKDNEIINDNVLDSLLEQADEGGRGGQRGLELIEQLTKHAPDGSRVVARRSTKVKRVGFAPKVA